MLKKREWKVKLEEDLDLEDQVDQVDHHQEEVYRIEDQEVQVDLEAHHQDMAADKDHHQAEDLHQAILNTEDHHQVDHKVAHHQDIHNTEAHHQAAQEVHKVNQTL